VLKTAPPKEVAPPKPPKSPKEAKPPRAKQPKPLKPKRIKATYPEIGQEIIKILSWQPNQTAFGIFKALRPRPPLSKFNQALQALEESGAIVGGFADQNSRDALIKVPALYIYQLGVSDAQQASA
jgi:hypothetical protein